MSILKALAEKSDSLNLGLQGRVKFYEHVYNSINFFYVFFFFRLLHFTTIWNRNKNGVHCLSLVNSDLLNST